MKFVFTICEFSVYSDWLDNVSRATKETKISTNRINEIRKAPNYMKIMREYTQNDSKRKMQKYIRQLSKEQKWKY